MHMSARQWSKAVAAGRACVKARAVRPGPARQDSVPSTSVDRSDVECSDVDAPSACSACDLTRTNLETDRNC